VINVHSIEELKRGRDAAEYDLEQLRACVAGDTGLTADAKEYAKEYLSEAYIRYLGDAYRQAHTLLMNARKQAFQGRVAK